MNDVEATPFTNGHGSQRTEDPVRSEVNMTALHVLSTVSHSFSMTGTTHRRQPIPPGPFIYLYIQSDIDDASRFSTSHHS